MAVEKKGPGRPVKELDLSVLEGLAEIQCTAEESARVLGVSPDTIDRRLKEAGYQGWADFYGQHSAGGRASLRRWQFGVAKDGNPTMLIWLGKQYLGQRDKQELSGPDGGPMQVQKVERVIVKAPDQNG